MSHRSLSALVFLTALALGPPIRAQIQPPPQAGMNDRTGPTAIPVGPGQAPQNRDMGMQTAPVVNNLTGMWVAKVGLEEITLAELRYAVDEYLRDHGGRDPSISEEDWRKIRNGLASDVLNHMIDQMLIVQEAMRAIEKRDKKNKQKFEKVLDKQFVEEKIPHLLKRHDAVDMDDLRRKLEQKGLSLDEIRKSFQNDVIIKQYVGTQLYARIRPELPELESYYHAHLHDFDSPAQLTFREIVLRYNNDAERLQARKKAEEVFARLRRGEDFGRLAQAVSQGSTAPKGGLWEKVQPGAFSPEVNAALDTLPIGRISPVIEGPNALRIVRVTFRRKAGPLSFEEAQKQVYEALVNQLCKVQFEKFLAKLRSSTIITTRFDGTESDPKVRRASLKPEDR